MKILLSLCLEPGDPAQVEIKIPLPKGEAVTLTEKAASVHVDASVFGEKAVLSSSGTTGDGQYRKK